MKKIEIIDFVDGQILREAEFRANVEAHDWAQYKDERVLIQGCSTLIVPTWAYLILVARLVPHAAKVSFGEAKHQIPVHPPKPVEAPAKE